MALVFWIFSYNRGDFLKNCVASVEQCAPNCAIHIFDDNSSDPDTRALLAQLGETYSVHFPSPQTGGSGKHGGLYANMQAAYEACEPDDLVCFLQDDMQLVRHIAPDEIAEIDDYLSRVEKPCFVYPAFLKGVNRHKRKNAISFDHTQGFYFLSSPKKSVGVYYSDIHICKVRRLRAVGWKFMAKESGNEQIAKNLLGKMAYLRNPFVFYLPYVPSYRGKVLTLALRLAHKFRNCGFYPFNYLTKQENQFFLTRNPAKLPYAEDFLRVSEALPQPWIYHPLQGKSWLKHLNSLEIKLRRWCGL